jgi:hypothetical protein
MRTTTKPNTSTIRSTFKVANPFTMNTYHSSKTMTMLNRLRQQQDTQNIAPLESTEEDESSTVQNIFIEKKSPISSNDDSEEQHQPSDLYTPLSYDEADENQLAEFFTTIDIDASFGGFGNVIDNLSEVPLESTRQSAKRRRLSNSGDSCSTAFSDETYEYDGPGLLRKQEAPVEGELSKSITKGHNLGQSLAIHP